MLRRLPKAVRAPTIRATLRWILVVIVLNGLVPGLAEAAETIVHYVTKGHVAHTAADQGDLGDQGPEHGCGTTQHHCACCATQFVAPAREVVIAAAVGGASSPIPPPALTLRAREPARPFRPPIA